MSSRFLALIGPVVATCLASGCLRPFDALGSGDGGDVVAPASDGGGALSIGGSAPDLVISDDAPAGRSGRDAFNNNLKPILLQRCAACHGVVGGLGPPFMQPDAYNSVLAWPGMVTRDPTHSLLVTRGSHNGAVYFSDSEKLLVLDWLEIEAAALPASLSTVVATPPQSVSEGANSVPLDPLGKDFLGASITFNSARFGSGIKVTGLSAHATGPEGLHIVHPLFIGVRNGVRRPDPVDNFDGYDITIANAKSAPLGPGLLILTNLAPNEMLSIAFQSLTASSPAMQLGGCKSVVDFTASARPAIVGAGCPMCHDGTNGTAKNALDMSSMNDLSAMGQAVACAQMRNRIDPVTPAQSQMFVVTDPMTLSNHKLRFVFANPQAFTTFTTAVSLWIVKE